MPPIYPDGHERDKRREASFDAPSWAVILAIVAIAPQFFVSILWWPIAAVLLFAALILGIVGLVQGRVLGAVFALLLVLLGGPVMMVVAPLIHAARYMSEQRQDSSTTTPIPVAVVQSPFRAPEDASTPNPAPTAAPTLTPTPVNFNADMLASQRAAVARYPALGIAGSPENKRFLALLAEWRARHDPRLERSDWPEVLAGECEK